MQSVLRVELGPIRRGQGEGREKSDVSWAIGGRIPRVSRAGERSGKGPARRPDDLRGRFGRTNDQGTGPERVVAGKAVAGCGRGAKRAR